MPKMIRDPRGRFLRWEGTVEMERDPQGRFTGFKQETPSVEPAAPQSDFVARHRQAGEPPPLPAAGAIPPPLPPRQEPPPLPSATPSGESAAATAATAAGGLTAGVVSKVLPGAAALWLAQQAIGFAKEEAAKRPIGTLEGGPSGLRPEAHNTRLLEALLHVQQQIARVGTPIKDQVKTHAAGSRM